ncbi:MAG: recombinase family protein [Clostridia bacterium]|nr:recombinase family protein [Clostridia bacterium]
MRAAAYARFSSDNQRVESIDAQLRAIKKYCTDNNILLVKTYTDEALSGTSSDKRDAFLQMIADAKKGMFDCVIVHKLDRFARNRYDSAIYRKELKDEGVRLISVLENFDEDNPESVLMMSIIEGYNEFYSLNLRREVMKGQLENAYKGLHNGGTPPLGYDVAKDRKLVINEYEAEAVRIIFDMFTRKYGYQLIADELNKKGYKTKSKKKFTKNSIAEILRNEKYVGRYVFNKRLSKKSGNRQYKKDEEIVRIENAFPAIVSEAIFIQAQDIINSRLKPRMGATRHYLLTGKIECACCGGKYIGSATYSGRNSKKYYNYESSNRRRKIAGCKNKPIRAELLEEFIIKHLKEHVFNDDVIDLIAEKLHVLVASHSSGFAEQLKTLTKKQKDIQVQIDKLLDLYLEGKISQLAIEKKTEGLQEELESLTIRINEIKAHDVKPPTLAQIKKYLHNKRDDLLSEDSEIQQGVIDTFIEKIIVGEDTIEVQIILCPLALDNNNNLYVMPNAYMVNGDGACTTLYATVEKALFIPKYRRINK